MKSIEERYMHDPKIKMIVDQLTGLIHDLEFTPSEVRDAAMLACINYERSRSYLTGRVIN